MPALTLIRCALNPVRSDWDKAPPIAGPVVDVEVRPGDHEDQAGVATVTGRVRSIHRHRGIEEIRDEKTGGRSLNFEASDRFVNKAKIALGLRSRWALPTS